MHIQYSEFRAPSASQGKCKLLKTPECKKHIQYSEKFLGNSVISGQAQVAQESWMWKVYSIEWNISGQLCFSGQAQSYSKIVNGKKCIQYSEKFQGKLFSGQAQVVKNPECKKYIQYSEKFQGNSDFSGQAQVSQKSWAVKKF